MCQTRQLSSTYSQAQQEGPDTETSSFTWPKSVIGPPRSGCLSTYSANQDGCHAAFSDMKVACFLQFASNPTGLTTSDGANNTFATAVDAIATLRNTLGGTTSSSVENNLLRTPTSYTSFVNTTGQPDVFAVHSNAVAFTRTENTS